MQQATLFRRERQFCVVLGFICVNLRDLRENTGVSSVPIDWVLLREYSPADYADHAEECSKAALYRRELHLVVSVVFGFYLRKSARSAGEYWGFFVQIDWVLLREYSPADYADHAEECSKAALYRRELHLVVIVVFGFYLRKSARSAGEYWGFFCADWLSTLTWIFSRR